MYTIDELNACLQEIKIRYTSCSIPHEKILAELHEWFMKYDGTITSTKSTYTVNTYKQCVDNYFNSANRVNIVQNGSLITWLFHCADECISRVHHKEFVYG